MAPRTLSVTAGVILLGALPLQSARADDAIAEYFAHWFDRVDAAQDSQPHWGTPLATTTARLTEQIRYDQLDANLPNGAHQTIFENGKGVDLIPAENIGIMIGIPPYEIRENVKPAQGAADWPFFRLKYRLLSANEDNGDYIATFILQFTAPTGSPAFTQNAYTIAPSLGFGKGWGNFDVQSTLGLNLPTSNVSTIGRSVVWNTAFQYRVARILWPEIELNDTYWQDGLRGGKNQILLTAGVVLGRMPLVERTSLTVGIGYQHALTPKTELTPALLPTLRNALYLSTRLNF